MSTRPSLRHAIDAHCKSCIFDPLSGGKWREQVALCSSANCGLFAVRPVPAECARDGIIIAEEVSRVRRRLRA